MRLEENMFDWQVAEAINLITFIGGADYQVGISLE